MIKLHLKNTYKTQQLLEIRWHVPAGWSVAPATHGTVFVPQAALVDHGRTLVFSLTADVLAQGTTRCVVELSMPGRADVMLVPVVLLHDSLTI